jgi:hypothetical protein
MAVAYGHSAKDAALNDQVIPAKHLEALAGDNRQALLTVRKPVGGGFLLSAAGAMFRPGGSIRRPPNRKFEPTPAPVLRRIESDNRLAQRYRANQ